MKRAPIIGAWCVSIVLLAVSAMLIASHVHALLTVRDTLLPLAARIPAQERRLQMLAKQTELAQAQQQLMSGSPDEQIHTFILPAKAGRSRVLALLDVTRLLMERSSLLRSMSAITVSEPVPATRVPSAPQSQDALTERTYSFTAELSPDGVSQFLRVIELSGLLRVGDAFTAQEIEQLFALTEAEDVTAIVPLQKFLAIDLATYTREPKLYEEAFLRAVSSERFVHKFRSILSSSRLAAARDVIGGPWGKTYIAQKLLPFPFLSIGKIQVGELKSGTRRVEVTLRGYERTKNQ